LGNYWNAFSTSLTVATLLIVIGSAISVINVLMSRRGDQSGSEAQ
jgi:ABC-type Fe3+ transport system permease subunit